MNRLTWKFSVDDLNRPKTFQAMVYSPSIK